MSLVGPRPLPADDGDFLGDVRRRLLVRPGITGLWQVSGRSDLSWDDAVRLDLYYVDNWSLAYDLSILWRTIGVVAGPQGRLLTPRRPCGWQASAPDAVQDRAACGGNLVRWRSRSSALVSALAGAVFAVVRLRARRGIATADPAGHLRRAAHRRARRRAAARRADRRRRGQGRPAPADPDRRGRARAHRRPTRSSRSTARASTTASSSPRPPRRRSSPGRSTVLGGADLPCDRVDCPVRGRGGRAAGRRRTAAPRRAGRDRRRPARARPGAGHRWRPPAGPAPSWPWPSWTRPGPGWPGPRCARCGRRSARTSSTTR